MRLYVAGPMSASSFGHAETPPGWDFNYPAFDRAAQVLRVAGFEVANPAEPGDRASFDWGDYLRRALVQMVTCDGVAMLPGWGTSAGVQLELTVASGLGMPALRVEDWVLEGPAELATRSSFAAQAQRVVDAEWLGAVAPE